MHSPPSLKLPKLASQPRLAPPLTALDTVIDPGHRRLPSLSSPARSSRRSVQPSGSPLSRSPRSPPPTPSSVATGATFTESVSLPGGVPPDRFPGERDGRGDSPVHFDRMVDTEVKLRLAQGEIADLRAQVGGGPSACVWCGVCGWVALGCTAGCAGAALLLWACLHMYRSPVGRRQAHAARARLLGPIPRVDATIY